MEDELLTMHFFSLHEDLKDPTIERWGLRAYFKSMVES